MVGIGDSGLDMDSCYFYDPALPDIRPAFVAVPPEEAGRQGVRVFRNATHRKVVQYYSYMGGWREGRRAGGLGGTVRWGTRPVCVWAVVLSDNPWVQGPQHSQP